MPDAPPSRPAAATLRQARCAWSAARKHPPMSIAVVHPCNGVALESAGEAARLKLVTPGLAGPHGQVAEVRPRPWIDISPFEVVAVGRAQPRPRRPRRWSWCSGRPGRGAFR